MSERPMDVQTIRAAALTNEELFARLAEDMIRLRQSGAGMRLEIAPEEAFAVVSFCQLAMRHPGTQGGPSAPLVARFIELVRAKFEPHAPYVAVAIERGNTPSFDEPRSGTVPPEAFGAYVPAPEEMRFWRMIEERQPDPSDGSELIILACGHSTLYAVPLRATQEYAYCPQCLNDWIDATRQEEPPPVLPPLKCPSCGYVTPRPSS